MINIRITSSYSTKVAPEVWLNNWTATHFFALSFRGISENFPGALGGLRRFGFLSSSSLTHWIRKWDTHRVSRHRIEQWWLAQKVVHGDILYHTLDMFPNNNEDTEESTARIWTSFIWVCPKMADLQPKRCEVSDAKKDQKNAKCNSKRRRDQAQNTTGTLPEKSGDTTETSGETSSNILEKIHHFGISL